MINSFKEHDSFPSFANEEKIFFLHFRGHLLAFDEYFLIIILLIEIAWTIDRIVRNCLRMDRPSAKKHRNRPVFEGGKIQLSQGKWGELPTRENGRVILVTLICNERKEADKAKIGH